MRPRRVVQVILDSGEATGILVADLDNWIGRVIVVPRSRLELLTPRPEARGGGAYMLVGPDPDMPNRDAVYVGETDAILKRLAQHAKSESKDFWIRAVFVVSREGSLSKSEVKYLESQLLALARAASRSRVVNSTSPEAPQLSEAELIHMQGFLDQLQLVLPVLGFSMTQPRAAVEAGVMAGQSMTEQPRTRTGAIPTVRSPLFVLDRVGVRATGQEANGEFVVMKGSTARKAGVASWTQYRVLRDQLISAGKLAEGEGPDKLVFVEDVPFASPSAAEAVVMARAGAGGKYFRQPETGQSYKEFRAERLRLAAERLGVET
jgi:hypothetical protein